MLVSAAAVLAVTLAGCGGDDEDAKGGKDCPSAPAPLTGPSGLPAGFPTPVGVVLTSTRAAGPSTVAEGYAEEDLGDVYDEWKKALGAPPWSVTKSEHESHDAEVNFAGPATSGQVRLGEACQGRTSVRITARTA